MPKKGLIMYYSLTGNTEKVALRFKKVFEKKGWQCDIFKVDKNTDIKNPPFDFRNYDFLCVGSLIMNSLPAEEILNIMRNSPLSGHYPPKAGVGGSNYRKVVAGPKKGIVFVTYGGAHMGPKEAVPALGLLELEMEHLRFKGVGRFACPGKMGNRPTPRYYFRDLYQRPNERDLMKAEIFMEEIIEEI